MGYIYKIQNKINGHVYIGQTVKVLEKRFQQHRNNYNKPYFSQLSLYKAFNKYGIENFTFEQVEEVPNEQLDEREKYWIEYYNSYKNGYNMSIDTYKLTSMEEPSDEVLEQLMREAAEEATQTNQEATTRFFEEIKQAAALY